MNFLIINLLNEGGATFMYPILAMLIACITLAIKAFTNNNNEKNKQLLKHISLFALVWGFLGQMIGLIGAFDSIEAFGNISPGILASGLKVALLCPTFGMFTFLIARLCLIGLTIKQK